MISLLRAVGARGEEALRRGVLAFAGAGLVVVSLGFAGAAIVEALSEILPRGGAFAVAALFLLIAASVCFSLSARRGAKAGAAPDAQAAFAAPADWRSALHLALAEEAREKPARAAALAALAGLVLGALEGFDHRRPGVSTERE
jgi:hypothetical protein